uniref:Tubulin polyglutamylase TTLL4 n=1 Tax=Timema poppense TaxID=170557 RepID=A0A7R9CME2_TIMPO|nr:unnamed protein product [Timema poppensis]
MATPYVTQKVPLACCTPGYHCESGNNICRESSTCNQCRFAYASWCPVCDARLASRSCRRRSRSEGVDADPLRESNRTYESRHEVEYSGKRVVKEYGTHYCDVANQTNETFLDMSPDDRCRSFPQSMEVDSCMDHSKPLPSKNLLPAKKFRERMSPANPGFQQIKCEGGGMNVSQHVGLPRVNENPRYASVISNGDSCPNKEQSFGSSSIRRPFVSADIQRKCSSNHCLEKQIPRRIDQRASPKQTPMQIYSNGVSREVRHRRPSNDFLRASIERNDVEVKPSKSLRVNTSTMQDHYLREVEVLRHKLKEIRDSADGKRLRQRSESEPSVGYAVVASGRQEYSWEPKRPRDNSPNLINNNGVGLQHRQPQEGVRRAGSDMQDYNTTARRSLDIKLPTIPVHSNKSSTSNSTKKLFISRQDNDEDCNLSSDSDFADRVILRSYFKADSVMDVPKSSPKNERLIKITGLRIKQPPSTREERTYHDGIWCLDVYTALSEQTGCSAEDGDSKGEPAEDSEEDDQSIMSSLTTVSTDSNTPSIVGETLGCISLNDNTKHHSSSSSRTDVGISYRKGPLPGYLRGSLFSYVPPYINFSLHDVKGESLPTEIQRLLKWKLSTITPLVVRRTLLNTGFRLVRKSNDWCGTWGKHMKSMCFKTLKEFQKINHFPGTFQIGRKDRLWKNLYRLMAKFGKKEFGFIPHTYVLPQDGKILRQAWEKSCGKSRWIIKPPASARGTGIKVVHRWTQIPKKRPLVVQKYISQPYLINGSKFDLRLYVLVTSINPLRIFIYDDGLVRFASVKYSADMSSLGDRYMHLTNYSINKLSSQYTQNEDATACQGHKWTVKTLWLYLEKDGVNVKALWRSMVDLVIKTIISGESSISQLTRTNQVSRYCSYELFGIDVLLDHELRPWLLEVNISPSLHSSSPLDLAVKGPLVRDLMNIAGYQIPCKLTQGQQVELSDRLGLNGNPLCFDRRLYTTALSRDERVKHSEQQQNSREEYLDEILEELTPDDVRHLIQSEDELTQSGNFIRIFPTPDTHHYHEFFEAPRYYNMMLDAWETRYHKNRQEGINLLESLCSQRRHLVVPPPVSVTKQNEILVHLPVISILLQTCANPLSPQPNKEALVPEDKDAEEKEKLSEPRYDKSPTAFGSKHADFEDLLRKQLQ